MKKVRKSHTFERERKRWVSREREKNGGKEGGREGGMLSEKEINLKRF